MPPVTTKRSSTLIRKLIAIAVSFTAIASLAVPALASADVARYQSETATFTMVQPAGMCIGQFDNVWTHNYTVKVNPCDSTFSGTGVETGSAPERSGHTQGDRHRLVQCRRLDQPGQHPSTTDRVVAGQCVKTDNSTVHAVDADRPGDPVEPRVQG